MIDGCTLEINNGVGRRTEGMEGEQPGRRGRRGHHLGWYYSALLTTGGWRGEGEGRKGWDDHAFFADVIPTET